MDADRPIVIHSTEEFHREFHCPVHTVVVSAGFRSRSRVQHVRMRLLAIWRWRDLWRAALENAWEDVEFADADRAAPSPELRARWRRRR